MKSELLHQRIDVYGKTEITNELSEKDYIYTKINSVWAEITPVGASVIGAIKNTEGNYNYSNMTYKIVIRSKSIPNLSKDMYFIHNGLRYDISYFNPSKRRDSIEIMCNLVVE